MVKETKKGILFFHGIGLDVWLSGLGIEASYINILEISQLPFLVCSRFWRYLSQARELYSGTNSLFFSICTVFAIRVGWGQEIWTICASNLQNPLGHN